MNFRLASLMAALIVGGSCIAFAQSYDDDDIYYNPSKSKAQPKSKPQQRGNYIVYEYPAADSYTPTIGSGTNIDVDKYNRRGVFAPADTTKNKSMAGDDFANTRRIERFSNPDVIINSNDPDVATLYYAQPANVNIYVNNDPFDYWGWSSPYYSSWYWGSPRFSWSWNWGWGPSWSWNWGWGPSWAWGPSWSWGWGWNYPGWGWGWDYPGWGWGHPGWVGPSRPNRPIGNVRPGQGYRPSGNIRPGSNSGYRPSSRPSYNNGVNSGYRPGNNPQGYRQGQRNSIRNNSNSGYRNNNNNNNSYRPSYPSRGNNSSFGSGSTGGYRGGGGSFGGGTRGGGGGRGRH